MWFYIRIICLVIFFTSLPVFVNIHSFWHRSWDRVKTTLTEDPTDNVYDFIVVGAGSAGSPLAASLSKHNKVLLIEAGTDPSIAHSVPGLAYELLNNPSVDWMYRTVPQKSAGFGFKDNLILWPRGKSLGGSSNLNYMFYLRGNPQDYDNWAKITNDSTWKYENVLPYFKKSLVYNGQYENNKKHYGKSEYGNLHVESRKYAPLGDEFINAGKDLGYDTIDANSEQRTGFGKIDASIRHGSRWGAYKAFLADLQSRKNLKIARFAQATKIKIDAKKRAIGVWYDQHGSMKFARARKEIIISAGSVDSPTLLMRSGIGPKEHLKSVGIKVKVNSKHVGQNLQDHTAVGLMPVTIEKPLSFLPLRDFTMSEVFNYFSEGTGVFTNPSAAGAQAFISSSIVRKTGVDWPDLQFYMFAAGISPTITDDFARVQGYNSSVLQPILEPVMGKDGFFILVTLVRPHGTGEIKLKDKNPSSHPVINPKYLESPKDMQVLVEGLKLAVKLAEESKTFKELGTQFHKTPFPQCDQHKWKSNAYWDCYVRHFAFSLYHPTSTCSMGKVVDSRLRVNGVNGLRIADASIMPVVVNANTNAPSIMIGEKAADLIREYWAQQYEICLRENAFYMVHDSNQCFYSRMV